MKSKKDRRFKLIKTSIMRLALLEFEVKTFKPNKDVPNDDFMVFLKQQDVLFAVVQQPGGKNSGEVPTKIHLCGFDGKGPNTLQQDFERGRIPIAVAEYPNFDEVDFIFGYYTGNLQGSLTNHCFVHCFCKND